MIPIYSWCVRYRSSWYLVYLGILCLELPQLIELFFCSATPQQSYVGLDACHGPLSYLLVAFDAASLPIKVSGCAIMEGEVDVKN